MVALLLVALLQSPAQACHEAPSGSKAECARQVVTAAEANVSGTVYCYPLGEPAGRPACFREPLEDDPATPPIPEPTVQTADCSLSLTSEYLLSCGSLNLAREEERMFRYLERVERNMREPWELNEESALAGPRSALALANSQQAWWSYAALACDQFEEQEGMARMLSLGCRIQLTRERTHTIWRHYLSAWRECDPEAPEPTMTVIDEIILRNWPSEGPVTGTEEAWCHKSPCPPSICGA